MANPAVMVSESKFLTKNTKVHFASDPHFLTVHIVGTEERNAGWYHVIRERHNFERFKEWRQSLFQRRYSPFKIVAFSDYMVPSDVALFGTDDMYCQKLVYNLSREVAVYCCLSMGIGGVSDSYVLRDELRYSGSKVFDLVLMCKRRLVPLILSKRLKEEEREDYEKLYRIFVSCLEMLQVEFIRSMALQSMFPLWDTSTLLIQTGASESQSHKKSCHILETLDASGLDRKMMDHEEIVNLERKVMTLQELCYTTSQMMDVNPWDYKPDTDHTKIEVDTSDGERDGFELGETRRGMNMAANRFDHTRAWKVNMRSPRYRKCIWITVFVVGTLVVVAGVIGLTFAFTKDDHPKD